MKTLKEIKEEAIKQYYTGEKMEDMINHALSEVAELVKKCVPEEAPHNECYDAACVPCNNPGGWNACRQEMIKKLKGKGIEI